MAPEIEISTPEELASMLDGVSDAEVENIVKELGVEAVLDKVFTSMVERFLPAKAGNENAIIQWHLSTTEGIRSYHLNIKAGTCTMVKGTAQAPTRVTLSTRIPVFLRIVAGTLTGLEPFSDGRLRVTGDQIIALKQQLWFDTDLSKAELNISKPSELARLIEGRSDVEINIGTSVTGVDKALEQVFRGMLEHYLPRKGPRKRSVVQFEIQSPEGERVYQFIADRSGSTYQKGARESANVKIKVELANFLRMVAGKLDSIKALALGKVKVRGNILLARGVQSWFDLSR